MWTGQYKGHLGLFEVIVTKIFYMLIILQKLMGIVQKVKQ